MNTISSFVRLLSHPGALVFLGLGLGYGVYTRWFITETSALGATIGAWDVVLESAASIQFLTFVALPAWIFFSILRRPALADTSQLIRHGSRWRAWAYEMRRSTSIFARVALLLVITWFVAAAGLPLGSFPGEQSSARIFAEAGILPALALVLQLGYLLLNLLVVQSMIVYIGFTRGGVGLQVGIGILMWTWAALSLNGIFDTRSIASAPYYLDLASVISYPGTGARAIAAATLVAASTCFLIREQDRRQLGAGTTLRDRRVVYGVLVVALLALAVAMYAPASSSAVGILQNVFFGSSGTLSQFLLDAFLFVGYAYLVHLRQSELREHLSSALLIRYGSALRLALALGPPEFLRGLGFVLILCAATLGFVWLIGSPELSFADPALGGAIAQVIASSTLQLCLYITLLLAATWLTKSPLTAPATAVGIVIVSALRPMLPGWVPFGLSGLSAFGEGSAAAIFTSAVLGVSAFMLTLAVGVTIRYRGVTV